MKHTAVQLNLTCGSWQEAQKITDALLTSKLVTCVEQFEVQSKYTWQGALEEAKEIKLIMTSIAEHFDAVEALVRKHHSYDTFVLNMMSVGQMNPDASQWLQNNIAEA